MLRLGNQKSCHILIDLPSPIRQIHPLLSTSQLRKILVQVYEPDLEFFAYMIEQFGKNLALIKNILKKRVSILQKLPRLTK